jgi:hypothetical protein
MMHAQVPEWPLRRLVFVTLLCTGYICVGLAIMYMFHLSPV